MAFLNIFGLGDSLGATEGNIGLGYRQLQNECIYGAYVFYDVRKSQHNNMYNQITFGIEHLRDKFEVRLNGYVPIGRVSNKSEYGNSVHIENALHGFDIEVGGNILSDLEGYVSFYYFGDKDVSMPGYRLRSSYCINSNIRLLGELSYDSVREFNYFAGVRLSASIGKGNAIAGLEKKMTQDVVRDIDVVVAGFDEKLGANVCMDNSSIENRMSFNEALSVLGLDIGASKSDVEKKYRKLARELHPDRKGGDTAKFYLISEAKDVLLESLPSEDSGHV